MDNMAIGEAELLGSEIGERGRLRQFATNLKISTNTTRPPIDILRVANSESFTVEASVDFETDEIYGVIDGLEKKIFVNNNVGAPYQSFAIAYLIGCFKNRPNDTHPDLAGNLLSATRENLQDDQDSATYFSRILLADPDLVKKYKNIVGEQNNGILSDLFVAPQELLDDES